MKKIKYILTTLILFLACTSNIYADLECTEQAAKQMANIVCHEYGTDYLSDPDLNFYLKITTSAVVLNNAFMFSGNTWYDKMMNLTDNKYAGYSSYKNVDFYTACSATDKDKRELLYIAGLVMNGKYALPSNMRLQAADYIVKANGHVWDIVEIPGRDDMYYGWVELHDALSTKDVFGRTISDTTNTHYRQLAKSLRQSSYTQYTSSNVCSLTKELGEEKYNITYDLVGGKWPSNASNPSNAKINTNVTISNPEKTITVTGDANNTGASIGSPLVVSQEFAGWTSSTAKGLESGATAGTSSSLSSWSGAATTSTVFKNLRSTSGTVKLVATWKQITKELPSVTKSGYTCTWNTKKDGSGTGYASKGRYTFVGISSSGFTLYAICDKGGGNTNTSEDNTNNENNNSGTNYLIRYVSDGGTNIPKTQVKESQESITISSEKPKRNGSVFVEWNTREDGKGKSYLPGDTYTQDASLTLYAIWKENGWNSTENPNTGLAAIVIFPLLAILSVIYIHFYIKRMQQNNIV